MPEADPDRSRPAAGVPPPAGGSGRLRLGRLDFPPATGHRVRVRPGRLGDPLGPASAQGHSLGPQHQPPRLLIQVRPHQLVPARYILISHTSHIAQTKPPPHHETQLIDRSHRQHRHPGDADTDHMHLRMEHLQSRLTGPNTSEKTCRAGTCSRAPALSTPTAKRTRRSSSSKSNNGIVRNDGSLRTPEDRDWLFLVSTADFGRRGTL